MNKDHRLLVALLICAGVSSLATFSIFTRPPVGGRNESVTVNEASINIGNSATANVSHPLTSRPNHPPQSQSEPLEYRREIKLLLESPVGHVSVLEATELVGGLKADSANALPELERLATSTNLVERLLGVYLLLEIGGPSLDILKNAAADISPYVQSETAAWLYLNAKFDEWNDFLADSCSSRGPNDLETILSLLDNAPARLDLPAAISLLGLGRGLPDYVVEMFRRNIQFVALAEIRLRNAQTPRIQKENLLSLLHQANPVDYVDILRSIIASSENDDPLRWQAVWNFGQTASQADSMEFLSDWLSQHPQDHLRDKLEESVIAISDRISASELPIARLERRLLIEMTSGIAPDNNVKSLFSHYVEQSIREREYRATRDLLERGKADYLNRTSSDQSFKRVLANINYLIWRSE